FGHISIPALMTNQGCCGRPNTANEISRDPETPMITPSYVRTMAAYNAEMNRRLYAGAERLGEEERRRDRGAFWYSLHGTLVHILWGDAQWMSRFDGWERPATPIKQSDHLIEGWAELCAAREKADADISRW